MKEEHKEDAKRIGRNILNLIIKNEIEQKDLAVALGVSEAKEGRESARFRPNYVAKM